MRKMNKRIFSFIMCLVCALALLPARSDAVSAIDTGRETALTVSYTDGGAPVGGVPFEIYYVASVGADGTFTLSGDFKDYPVRINGLSAEGQRALAGTLAAYVDRDGLSPYDSGETNSQGLLYFPKQRTAMSTGMYLVVGRTHTVDGRVYTTEPFVVTLPTQVDGKWEYKVIVEPKHSVEELNPSDETVSHSVVKIWNGDVGELRPTEITVRLLRDGQVYDTVCLNGENNWCHTWNELPKYNSDGTPIVWRVAEDEVSGYSVTVTLDSAVFIVSNTYDPKPSDDTVSRTVQKRWSDTGYENKRPASVTVELLKDGEVYDTVLLDADGGWKYTWDELPRYDADGNEISWTLREVSVKGYTASVTQTGDIFVLTNTYDKTKLPQTGQLWWPVPLLAAAGLGLICVGLSMRKRDENE